MRVQWLLFSVISVSSLWLLRGRLARNRAQSEIESIDSLVGERIRISTPIEPGDVLGAMEKQMRAEREKRAVVLGSEGDRDARINEAEGRAQAILAVARATAEGLHRIAEALQAEGGTQAMQLRIAEQYIQEFGNLAKEGNTFVVPANLSDISSMITLATGIARADGAGSSASVSPRA